MDEDLGGCLTSLHVQVLGKYPVKHEVLRVQTASILQVFIKRVI
jgi:hypothetical protein